jgi:hypothetical protein
LVFLFDEGYEHSLGAQIRESAGHERKPLMLQADLYADSDFLRQLAESREHPFVGQGHVLRVDANEVSPIAVIVDDLFELGARGVIRRRDPPNGFSLMHFLFQRAWLRFESLPTWDAWILSTGAG